MKKKKVFIIIVVVIIILYKLLWPDELIYRDGGSKEYRAVLYSVMYKNSHYYGAPPSEEPIGKKVGTIVTIFGIEVYNDVKIVTMEDYRNGNY